MMIKKEDLKKTIGLALGGGGARGFGHIGVLEVLEKNNIKPDMISGTSAGAIIASMYALGMSPIKIKKTVEKIKYNEMIDFDLPSEALIPNDKIKKILKRITHNKSFKDTKIPLKLTTVDLKSKKLIILESGKLWRAILASISIPGVFPPVRRNNMKLVDGGIIDNVPTRILKKNGMDFVIGVNVNFPSKKDGGLIKKSELIKELQIKLIRQEMENIKIKILQKTKNHIKRKMIYSFVNIIVKPEKIIANINKKIKKYKMPEILDIMYKSQAITLSELTKERLKNSCDYAINLPFADINLFEFDQVDYVFEKGKKVTKKHIQDLKQKIIEKMVLVDNQCD